MRGLLAVFMLLILGCQDEIKIHSIKKSGTDDMNKSADSTEVKKTEKQCTSDSDCQQGQKCVSKTCTKAALEIKKAVDLEQHSDYFFINTRKDTWR